MSQLYDMKLRIEELITAQRLDEKEIKGKIALHSGKLLAFISPTTPDDPDSIAKLKQAAKEILNVDL